MDNDIYKIAAKTKMRFPSPRMTLTVEQLFELPLRSPSGDGFDLDTVAKTINNELKSITEESFVDVDAKSPTKARLENMLAIVKDVIETKQKAIAAQKEATRIAETRRKLNDLIERKKDEALAAVPVEELEKQLQALPS